MRTVIRASRRAVASLLALLALAGLSACQGPGTPEPPVAPAPAQPGSARAAAERAAAGEMLALVNDARQRAGVGPLALDDRLCLAARRHALDVARMAGPSHTGSDGSTPGKRASAAGYHWSLVAENIAGSSADFAAAGAMTGWLNSPSHRANLLNPAFTHLGVARVGNFWVQVFAKP